MSGERVDAHALESMLLSSREKGLIRALRRSFQERSGMSSIPSTKPVEVTEVRVTYVPSEHLTLGDLNLVNTLKDLAEGFGISQSEFKARSESDPTGLLKSLSAKLMGKARGDKLTPEQRRIAAQKAVNARWHPPTKDSESS